MKHTTKTVKYNMTLAKKRLNAFSSRLGKKVELDEEYFLSLSPRKADNELKKIRWSNTAKDKGGVSYRGIKIDDQPARRRIYRKPEPKEPRKPRATAQQKELTKAMNNAQARLKNFGKKAEGMNIKLDRSYYRSLPHKQAMAELNKVRFANRMDANMYKGLNVYSVGVHPKGKYEYKTKIDKPEEMIPAYFKKVKVFKKYEKFTIYSKTNQDKQIDYYNKFNTVAKKKAFDKENAEKAGNNITNKLSLMASKEDTPQGLWAKAVLEITKNWSVYDGDYPQGLHDLVSIDMYDSEPPTTLETLLNNFEDIKIEFYTKIHKTSIEQQLRQMGYSETQIEEVMKL